MAQARQDLDAGDAPAALAQYENAVSAYDQALTISPTNVEAMTYRAWVLHLVASGSSPDQAAQLEAEARRGLDQAVATDPGFADARVFRASVLSVSGDYAGAQADLDALDPSQIPAFMTTLLDELRAEVAAGLAGSGSSTPTAP
jgi:cytochrome c-type biogenesis protein CcmH/NrfG